MRIHRDPAADAAGGGAVVAPATATPTPSAPSTQAATAPATPPIVPLTVEEYQRLRDGERKLAEFETRQREALEAKERDRLKALADKEGADKALAKQEEEWRGKYTTKEQELAGLKGRWLSEKLTNVVSTSLDGVTFLSPAAAKDAREKLEKLLVASEDASGTVTVRDKVTGRPAADVIKESLASPDFAHFLAATTRGGTGAVGGNRSNATPSPANTPDATAERIARVRAAIDKTTANAPGLTGTYGGNIHVGSN